jgi:hypothetical protein
MEDNYTAKKTNTRLNYTNRKLAVIPAVAILLLVLSSMSCAKVRLNEATRNEGLLAESPFQLYGSVIITEVSVDESGPLNFIFDTGAGATIVNSKTAARLGIVGDETVSREGATGTVEITRSTNHIVDIGELRFQDVTLGIAEIDYIEKRMGIQIDGVIGWEILSRYAVRIDYDRMLIEIYDNSNYEYDFGDSGYPIEVKGTSIFTNVTVALDSGNTLSGAGVTIGRTFELAFTLSL